MHSGFFLAVEPVAATLLRLDSLPAWAPRHKFMNSVVFDAAGLVRNLDIIAKIQLPFVAAVTVNRLAKATKQALQREMLDSFKRTSPYTLRSIETEHFATKTEPWTYVQHMGFAGKGNAAANYLRPQITGGMVFRTRFQNRLNSELDGYNGRYMLPLENSPGAKRGPQGRIRPSQYVEALYGIKAMESVRASSRPGRYRTQGSYAYVPYVGGQPALARQMRALGRGRIPKAGIYRIMQGKPVQVFKQLQDIPSVPMIYDFAYAAQVAVEKNVQTIFDKAFAFAAGRSNS